MYCDQGVLRLLFLIKQHPFSHLDALYFLFTILYVARPK